MKTICYTCFFLFQKKTNKANSSKTGHKAYHQVRTLDIKLLFFWLNFVTILDLSNFFESFTFYSYNKGLN